MKRIHLIEWGIVTIALIFGYKFVESLFSFVVQLVYEFAGNDIAGEILRMLFIAGLYAGLFAVLIRNSYKIAKSLSGTSAGEILPFRIGKKGLLQVILITLCVYAILSNITHVIFYVYDSFRKEVGGSFRFGDDSGIVSQYKFQLAAGQVIVALIVLFLSKDIAGWFVRKNEVDELLVDSTPENRSDVQQ